MFTFLKGSLYFRMFMGNSTSSAILIHKKNECQEKNCFMYQPMYFCNPPRKDDCQTDYFLQNCLLCLISYLALYSLLLRTEPGSGNPQHQQPTSPVDVLLRRDFGLALTAHSSPWRSAFYQLSLRIRGYPPFHFHLSAFLILIIFGSFSIYCVVRGVDVLLLWKITFALCFQFSLLPLGNVQVEKGGMTIDSPDLSCNYLGQ